MLSIGIKASDLNIRLESLKLLPDVCYKNRFATN